MIGIISSILPVAAQLLKLIQDQTTDEKTDAALELVIELMAQGSVSLDDYMALREQIRETTDPEGMFQELDARLAAASARIRSAGFEG